MTLGLLNLAGLPLTLFWVPLLAAVILCDLRSMRIPHLLTGLLALLFVLCVPGVVPVQELLFRLLAGGLVFSVGFAAFTAGMLGGGDVKLLPVVVLFVPPHELPLFALFLSGGLIVGLITVRMLRQSVPADVPGWTGITQADRYPLGPGIGLAGIGYALAGPQVGAFF